MPGNKHVYTLDLENNQLLTDTGLEALRLVLPRCCVERMRLEDTAVTALQQAQLETSLAANRSRNIAVALVRPHQRLRLAALFERERLVPERMLLSSVAEHLQASLSCPASMLHRELEPGWVERPADHWASRAAD